METPKDSRILHLILASQNVAKHEPQVALQIMDFAHRYTAGVLTEAVVYNDYAASGTPAAGGASNAPAGAQGAGGAGGAPGLTNEDVKLAIAARTATQFQPVAPKKHLMELAAARNERPLPAVMPLWGVRLPPERYCLTNDR